MTIHPGSTLGAVYIGNTVAAMYVCLIKFSPSHPNWLNFCSLYGMTIIQTFNFFRTSSRDRMSLRIMVRSSYVDVLTRYSNRLIQIFFLWCLPSPLTIISWAWRKIQDTGNPSLGISDGCHLLLYRHKFRQSISPFRCNMVRSYPCSRTSATHSLLPAGVWWYLPIHVLHHLFIPIVIMLQGQLFVAVSFTVYHLRST